MLVTMLSEEGTMEFGLFLIRAVVGLSLAAHGAQKLFGMFGGYGIAGTGRFFDSLGFRPGRVMAAVAGVGETAGGLAFALGLLTPFAAAVIVATMTVAVWGVHLEKGFFSQSGGYELPLIVGAIALGIAFTGAGPLSLDAALGLPLAGMAWGLVALGLGLAGAVPPLVARGVVVRQKAA
jgi:putative oxidoreductase